MDKVRVCRVVYDDGEQAYNTWRALFVDEYGEITERSTRELQDDMICAGCELLKVQVSGALEYDSGLSFYQCFPIDARNAQIEQYEIENVVMKFVEYFCNER